jgi:hypothetical protein
VKANLQHENQIQNAEEQFARGVIALTESAQQVTISNEFDQKTGHSEVVLGVITPDEDEFLGGAVDISDGLKAVSKLKKVGRLVSVDGFDYDPESHMGYVRFAGTVALAEIFKPVLDTKQELPAKLEDAIDALVGDDATVDLLVNKDRKEPPKPGGTGGISPRRPRK